MNSVDKTAPAQTGTITFEFDLTHSPQKVWRALTTPELLAQWRDSVGAPAQAALDELARTKDDQGAFTRAARKLLARSAVKAARSVGM